MTTSKSIIDVPKTKIRHCLLKIQFSKAIGSFLGNADIFDNAPAVQLALTISSISIPPTGTGTPTVDVIFLVEKINKFLR